MGRDNDWSLTEARAEGVRSERARVMALGGTRWRSLIIPAISVGMIAMLAGCADRSGMPERSFQSEPADPEMYELVQTTTGRGFDVLAEIREGFDGIPFGRISAVAAFVDGGFVLYESSFCRLHVFAADFTPTASFSGCGDGPTELRVGTKLLTAGDTVVVIDTRRRRLARFSRSGEYLDSPPLVLPGNGPLSFQDVAGLSDGMVYASFVTSLRPNPTPAAIDPASPLLVRYVLADGSIREQVQMQHPRIAYESGFSGLMGYPICASPDGDDVVMLNRWSHEVAIVRSDSLALNTILRTDDSWPAFVIPKGARMGSPPTTVLGVACGEGVFVASQSRMNPEDFRATPVEGWMLTATYDGEVRSIDSLTRADSGLFGVPDAMVGDRVLIRNNTGLDVPTLVIARLRGSQ